MTSQFELPANLTAEKLMSKLSGKFETQLVAKQYFLKTYYDSFDWRLYRHGMTCEFNRSKQSSSLAIFNRKSNVLVASSVLFDVPSFSTQFNPGKVRQTLEPLLEMRALQAVCTLEGYVHHINILNKDEKIVLRLLVEEFELLNNRLTLKAVKGYDKILGQITEIITTELGIIAVDKPILLEALRLQGRHPNDYVPKLAIKLSPEMRADIACKTIFSQLLRIIKVNEQGTIANSDTEFLHDFRVAVRKTRSGLSQVNNVLPDEIIAQYKEFFSWLGQITGETRDLDVYLLNFEQYRKKLPSVIRQSINPLRSFLLAKQQKSQAQLAKKLRSNKYLTSIAEWEQYLSSNMPRIPTEGDAELTVKEFADHRIWKIYKQALKVGKAIDEHSPPEALHKLRKTCKKLRYLMEFFQSLYPENRLDKLLDSLKSLQDVLGEYQDYAVQQERLEQFSEEMQGINTPAKTFLAMGALIEDFEIRKSEVRERFTAQFAHFKKAENQASFQDLFGLPN